MSGGAVTIENTATMENAVIKIQRAWRKRSRGRLLHEDNCTCYLCSQTSMHGDKCLCCECVRARNGICYCCCDNEEACDPDMCRNCKEAVATIEMSDGTLLCQPCSRVVRQHYCGDWLCPGDCGVLRCGCIDVCRCYGSWRE